MRTDLRFISCGAIDLGCSTDGAYLLDDESLSALAALYNCKPIAVTVTCTLDELQRSQTSETALTVLIRESLEDRKSVTIQCVR